MEHIITQSANKWQPKTHYALEVAERNDTICRIPT